MVDRHWLGDLGLAILLALPLAALAQPLPSEKGAQAAQMASMASNDPLQAHGRISLMG